VKRHKGSKVSDFPAEFQRAFVAVRYFLGAREGELGAPLGAAPEAEAVARRLAHADRQKRAEALAAELGRVVRALDAGAVA
jgi:hypothetical protein